MTWNREYTVSWEGSKILLTEAGTREADDNSWPARQRLRPTTVPTRAGFQSNGAAVSIQAAVRILCPPTRGSRPDGVISKTKGVPPCVGMKDAGAVHEQGCPASNPISAAKNGISRGRARGLR